MKPMHLLHSGIAWTALAWTALAWTALGGTARAATCLNAEDQLKSLASSPPDTRVTVAVTDIHFVYEDDWATSSFIVDLKKSHCHDPVATTVADLHLDIASSFHQLACDTVILNGVQQPISDYSDTMLEILVRGESDIPYKLILQKAGDRHLLETIEEMYNNGDDSHVVSTTNDFQWGPDAPSDDVLKTMIAPFCR